MRELGTVIEKENGKAIIKFSATPACSGCKMGCSAMGKERTIEAIDPLGVKVGETVEVEFEERKLLFGAFLAYLLPVFFFFVGYLFGIFLGKAVGVAGEGPAIISSFVFFGLSFLLLKLGFERGILKTSDFVPVIIRRYQ
jgi:positive regulator of sigma E activity